MTEEKNIYEKIQAVANELKAIEKDMTVGKGNYAYKAVSDLSVTKLVKEMEAKHGIVSIPTRQELVNQETIRIISDDKESIKFSFIIKMTVEFVNLSNPSEKIEVESYGHGLDTADKGFGKASTYARKYALLNAYKIATGEDPDNEKSDETKTPKTISEKRIAVENYLNADVSVLNSTLQHFGLDSISTASEKDISVMYENLKKKGKL